MQRIQIYEYVTALVEGRRGGAGGAELPAPSLVAEGRAMRDAAAADFARVPGVAVEVITHLPPDCSHAPTLLIAPECDGILERLARQVLASGGSLLGPSPEAIRLCGDKLALASYLRSHGVPTPETWPLEAAPPAYPQVWKPRDGVGSQGVHLVETAEAAARPSPPLPAGLIAQPFIPGSPVSIALLIGPRQTLELPPCTQDLSADGRFHYLGGSLPVPAAWEPSIRAAARAAVACVPGLLGYVGIDLVADARGATLIEINPRLTSSYLGLREACGRNLAEVWWRLLQGEPVAEPTWDLTPRSWRVEG